ncbi:MAG: hypothetical protein JWN99_31 [Ilumatobacteraceae bacterium]|nr:hypothetical protein [Ilumatobacteraceae bacterium]
MTIAVDHGAFDPQGVPARTTAHTEQALARRLPGLATAAVMSIGAGAIHAAAAGVHAEHPELARIFIMTAVVQLGVGLLALARPSRVAALAVVGVSAAAVAAWVVTRVSGISWIAGLEVSEAPQFADSACALLAGLAAGAALASMLVGWQLTRPVRLFMPGLAAAALTIPAMLSGGTHVHSHTHDTTSAAAATAADGGHNHDSTATGAATTDTVDPNEGHTHGDAATGVVTTDTTHAHDDTATATAAASAAANWPRPWDPANGIDVSGVPGVTPEQEARAVTLIQGSLQDLPKYADTAAAVADGYVSIGDAGTGSEHYIKPSLINDDVLLDPTQPESLVYTVKGDQRILAGAMYIASARPTDDPSLVNWAGPLMQWHNHGDLCWDQVNGVPTVVGIVDSAGNCARGVNTGGQNPMVHVWITPHPCGVFAALEGVGAGQTAVPDDQRVDKCQTHDHTATVQPKPYDPTQPIDLSGIPGVTPEQQAAAENLVAITVVRLPQWSDYRVAEAAGFKSIGDALTGHEHFIQWDWINDETVLDPDKPESLVYEPQPDGSKKLVSAMYMLPDTVPLDHVPDIGGALMQWHIHDNLCFTMGDAPQVAGVVSSSGTCRNGLEKLRPSPMIHVWITPNACGPFAALEGVGAGSIADGQTRLCDHVHGDGLGL